MGFSDLNQRSLDIFRRLVDTFMETGEPVGSRTISRKLSESLSPATIRNVMADLEEAGLLYAPHTSAGRLPTDAGLQFFLHGLLEVGNLSEEERHAVEKTCQISGRKVEDMLDQATTILSGLSNCAGVLLVPKMESALKQIEFVQLGGEKVLVIMITEDGVVENRIVDMSQTFASSTLIEASNYLTQTLSGRTLSEVKELITKELLLQQERLDTLTARIIQEGVAVWSGEGLGGRSLIVRGQGNLLQNVTAMEDIDQVRGLFHALEAKENFISLLDAAIKAEGVQIFVGSEHELFKIAGCSMVVAPYKNSCEKIIGAIGVLGPTRMNYGKIIPLVDYTAKVIGKLLEN